MITILVPLLVAVVGALVYGLANGKASELGRLAYAAGLLVTLFGVGQHVLKL